MLTRESWLWWAGLFGSIILGLSTLGDSIVDYGIPATWLPYIRLGALVVGIVSAWMKTSPFPSRKDAGRIDPAKLTGLLLALAILPLTSACGKNLSFQTNPVGATAHYATQVTRAAQGVQDAVITAHAGGLMSKDAAASVVKVTVQIGVKAQELATALSELDKLGLEDLGRKPIVAKVALILQTTNELVYQLNVADYFATLSPESKAKIRSLLQEISHVLLLVAQGGR